MAKRPKKATTALYHHLRNLLDDSFDVGQAMLLDRPVRLVERKIEVPHKYTPIRIDLGGDKGKRLHLYPELPLDGSRIDHPPSFLLVDPGRFFDEISGFIRLDEGDKLTLGQHDSRQQALFNYPKGIRERHLTITHKGDRLVFRDLSDGSGTTLTPLSAVRDRYRLIKWRAGKLARIRQLYGGPLRPLEPEAAYATLKQVRTLMENEAYRRKNSKGAPGGLLALPHSVVPVIIGDLHAQVDNLLVVLSQNNFLEGLESGKAALIILGDAVHSDQPGQLEEMEGSILIMDLILKLKLRFPKRVFYLRGNHDSFSPEVGKGGVPQGLLWGKALERARGKKYRKAMERFIEQLPYVAYSKHFLACHAGPSTAKVNRQMLVDITQYPGLQGELVTARFCDSSRPHGYKKGDVKRLRKGLELQPETPFIVGHTPLTLDDTVWLNIGGISNHHVVFGAAPYDVAVFTRVNKQVVPLHYHTEPLLGVINDSLDRPSDSAPPSPQTPQPEVGAPTPIPVEIPRQEVLSG